MPNRIRGFLVTALVSCLAAGCQDSTGSGSGLQVTVTASPQATIIERAGALPMLQCDVRFLARATGSRSDTATWSGATLRFYIGSDRATPVDSFHISGTELNAAFEPYGVAVGRPASVSYRFTAGIPFAADISFRYQVRGRERTTDRADFVCGASPSGAGAPQVTSVTFAPDEVEPGGRLHLAYQFSVPAGLWATVVELRGAFMADTVISESFRTSGTREVSITVPGGAYPGIAVEAVVWTVDVGGQVAEHGPFLGPLVVDRTPPELTEARAHYNHGRRIPGAEYLELTVTAQDNGQLRRVIYEFGAPISHRDSVDLQGSTARVPVHADWHGESELTVRVRDAGGNLSPGVSAGSFWIYPTRLYPMRSTMVGSVPVDIARSPSGDAYLAMGIGLVRLPIDTFTPVQLSQDTIHGVDVSRTGDTLWTINANTADVTWRDPTNPARSGRLRVPGTLNGGVRVLPDGKLLVAGRNPRRLTLLDPGGGEPQTLYEASGSTNVVGDMAAAWDGSRVLLYSVFDCARVYVAATAALSPCRTAGWGNVSASITGNRFLHGLVARDADGVALPGWSLRTDPVPTVISPDGRSALVLTFGGIDRIPLHDRERPTERIALPMQHPYADSRMFFVDARNLLVFIPGGGGARAYLVELEE